MYRVAGVTTVNIDSLPRKANAVQDCGQPRRKTFQVFCPLLVVARTFGLLPCCLREQYPSLKYSDSGSSLIWLHCFLHLALVVYSVLTASLCLLFAVASIFYVVLTKESLSTQFAIFDGILVWQAALISGHFLFVRNRLRLYFRLLDSYIVTYQCEKFNRDRTATVIAFAERQKSVRSSYTQTSSSESLEPSLDKIYKYSKLWGFFLSVVASVTVCCVVIQGIWSQMEYDRNTVTPMVGIAKWIAIRSSRWYVLLGTAVDSFSIAYNVIPQVIFTGCALPLIYLIQHFNDKTSRCCVSELDTDTIAGSHYRLRGLVKALDDCFSIVVFVTVAGDFFQLMCGTYLGCSLLRLDARCSRYFAREVMLVLRLCLVLGTGVALQEKVQGLLPTLEEYSTKSLLNTEKLKILTMFQILPNCGITGCSFFVVTRSFTAKVMAFSIAYGIVLWKLTS